MCDIGKTTAVHKGEAAPIIVKPRPVIVQAEPIKIREMVPVRRIRRETRI